jgi:hypothetical protein
MATDHYKVDIVETLKLVGVILAALIASRTIWAGVRSRYLKGWGSRKVWRRKLNLLANGATADYVKDLLGTPIFENHQGPSIWLEEDEKPKWVDHVFSTPHAWVVTRRIEDRLEAWSVTITDPKFWWQLEDVTFNQVKGRLGRVTFGDLLDASSGKYESSGARSGVYAESASFGNPGGYQTYIFMHNQEGIGTMKPSGNSDVRVGDFKRPDDRQEYPASVVGSHRSETMVNTIIVSWQRDEITQKTWQLWPIASSDQMRLLHRFQKKDGWQKKRISGNGNG